MNVKLNYILMLIGYNSNLHAPCIITPELIYLSKLKKVDIFAHNLVTPSLVLL